MNTINVIALYRYLGMWVFDDLRAGLALTLRRTAHPARRRRASWPR
jgi:hypothetical protein